MPLDAKALGAMQPGLGGLLGLVGDVLPFVKRGPNPMNLTEGAGRSTNMGGYGGQPIPFGPRGLTSNQVGPSTPAADKTYAELMKFLSTDAGKYWWAMMGQAK